MWRLIELQVVRITLILAPQAVRNEVDLESLACPRKYRAMNSFWKYYAGELRAPVTTVFIGGNHEASNYLWDL